MSAQVISLLDRLPKRGTENPAAEVPKDSGTGGQPLAQTYPELAPTLRKYIRALTRDLLGREPTPGETQDWTNQMLNGTGRRTVASCLLHSEEYRRKMVVGWYERFLRRSPGPEALQFWSEMLSTKRREDVLTGLLTSPEYVLRGGGNNENFVIQLYQDLLGRKPGVAEVSSWVGLLNSQSATRMCVANNFLTSREYREQRIRRWYLELLEREPAVDTLKHHLELFREGETEENLMVALLSGSEYFSRAISRRDL